MFLATTRLEACCSLFCVLVSNLAAGVQMRFAFEKKTREHWDNVCRGDHV